MPPLIEQQTIPENEEHPYVGDSIGGVEYVSGFLSKNSIHIHCAYQVTLTQIFKNLTKILPLLGGEILPNSDSKF